MALTQSEDSDDVRVAEAHEISHEKEETTFQPHQAD